MSSYILCEIPDELEHLTLSIENLSLRSCCDLLSENGLNIENIKNATIGDVIAFGNFRDSMSFIIDSELTLIQSPDYGGEGFLSIPASITKYIENPLEFFSKLAVCTISFEPDHPFLLTLLSKSTVESMCSLFSINNPSPVGEIHVVFTHPAFTKAINDSKTNATEDELDEWSTNAKIHSQPSLPSSLVFEFVYGKVKFDFEMRDTIEKKLKEVEDQVKTQLEELQASEY